MNQLGMEVHWLDKSPGIYSARWGGRYGDFSKAIRKVYRELIGAHMQLVNLPLKE